MKKRMVDVLPGEVFELSVALSGHCLFLKLGNQRVVNLTTSYLCLPGMDLNQEVETKQHPLGSYLFVGGIDKG